jgi:hypothetical protein
MMLEQKKWKQGEVHPETGMVFSQYDKRRGEVWATREILNARIERKRARANEKYKNDSDYRLVRVQKQKAYSKRDQVRAKERIRSAKRRECPDVRRYHCEKRKEWASKNKDRQLARVAAWHNHKRATDPLFNLAGRYRRSVNKAISLKGIREIKTSNLEILGCTWAQFFTHIESLFDVGMTWDNRHLWEIDHVVPMASAKTHEDVVRLNHYSNLKPLWLKQNRSKGAGSHGKNPRKIYGN